MFNPALLIPSLPTRFIWQHTPYEVKILVSIIFLIFIMINIFDRLSRR